MTGLTTTLAIMALTGWGLLIRTLWYYREKPGKAREGRSAPNAVPALDAEERLLAAIHEGGHALVAHCLGKTPSSVSLVPGPAGVAATLFSGEPQLLQTDEGIRRDIAVLLAGRLSEQLLRGMTTSSCIHDLKAARFLACQAVLKLGMGKRMGLLTCDDTPEALRALSERTRVAIDEDVREFLEDAAKTANELLCRHRSAVEGLARALVEKGTVGTAELQGLLPPLG